MLPSAILFIILLFPCFFLKFIQNYRKNITLKIDIIEIMQYNNIVLKEYFGFEYCFNQIGKMSRIIFLVKINERNDKYEKNISISYNGFRN